MLIYRVEDKGGGGPYNGEHAPAMIDFFFASRIDNALHDRPGPEDDISGFRHNPKYKFAFESLRQLGWWFSPSAQLLYADHGYSVAVYEVPEAEVKAGRHQVAYPYADAKLVKRIMLPLVNDG